MKRPVRLLMNLILVLICMGFAAVVFEFIARWTQSDSGFAFDRPSYLTVVGPSERFRDPRPVGSGEGKPFTLLVLGDSYTWGANVPMDMTWPTHLEWLLNIVGTHRYQVINHAISGANTADELKLLEESWGSGFDRVLIGYFLDDPDTDRAMPPPIDRVHRSMRSLSPFSRRLLKISVFYRRLLVRKWRRRLVSAQIAYIEALYRPESQVWKAEEARIERIAHESRSHHVPVLIVLWPHLGFPLDDRYPFAAIHRQLRKAFVRQGLPVLDLLAVFHNMKGYRLQAVPLLDPHPNETAHRVVAEAVFDWLRNTDPAIASSIVGPRIHPNSPMQSVRLRMAPIEGFRPR